jgi:hypothetical protein
MNQRQKEWFAKHGRKESPEPDMYEYENSKEWLRRANMYEEWRRERRARRVVKIAVAILLGFGAFATIVSHDKGTTSTTSESTPRVPESATASVEPDSTKKLVPHDPLIVEMSADVSFKTGTPVITGSTNLPNGTILVVTLRDAPPECIPECIRYEALEKVTVQDGQFSTSPQFGENRKLPHIPLLLGIVNYFGQPKDVEESIGLRGEAFRGPYAFVYTIRTGIPGGGRIPLEDLRSGRATFRDVETFAYIGLYYEKKVYW